MANQNSGLRFDTREIAVIFSLFIFVSLLMFTVGILVGKGLAQARYEGSVAVAPATPRAPTAITAEAPNPASLGTSVSTNSQMGNLKSPTASEAIEKHAEAKPEAPVETNKGELTFQPKAAEKVATAKDTEDSDSDSEPKDSKDRAPLELMPKKKVSADLHKDLKVDFPKTAETESLLKNPKIASIFDKDPNAKKPVLIGDTADSVERDFTKPQTQSVKRSTASVPSTKLPLSAGSGKYTVQVGSFPEQKEASERVEALKKMGFPFAYLSAKEMEDNKGTWYRVWLGYYPTQAAKAGGEVLQARGEVKNYLVRKSDAAKN